MKRLILNVFALGVIVAGASELKAQYPALQVCCVASITRVSCCGSTCDSGYFQCSAAS